MSSETPTTHQDWRDAATFEQASRCILGGLVLMLPKLCMPAFRYCVTNSNADEAVRSAYACARGHWRRWRGAGSLQHWLTEIRINTQLDELQSRRLCKGPDMDGNTRLPDNEAAEPVDPRYLDRVAAEIERLPREQRDVLLLVIGEGLSYRDTADELGIPVDAVMNRIARARGTLIQRLDGAWGESASP